MEAPQRQADRRFQVSSSATHWPVCCGFCESLEKKVVVELDGGQHALDPGDKIRDEWLRAEGYKVLRFWDNQVFSNFQGVLENIRNALLTPHPDPLPPWGEGR